MLGSGHGIDLPRNTLDGIWSYDVFVHINPVDARGYLREFQRVLRPGAYAIIHHPGHTSTTQRSRDHRSDLTDAMIDRFAQENDLEVVLQTTELVNVGDVLTVLRKAACTAVRPG